MAEIQGTCDDKFTAVRDVLSGNLDSGADVGASVAVYIDGQAVVDIWGGHTDAAKTKPWERDTIVNVWSTTKTMTALCALILADRGEIDFHAPVARYWPDFKANGKEHIEVRHLMGHTSGLSGWTEAITTEDLYDWEKCTSLLAAQAPWWEPGTASGYHAITQGYLVGEVVRRVTGQSLGTFFRTELAEPLGADFHIGTPASADARISNVIPPPPIELDGALDPTGIPFRTMANPGLSVEAVWTEGWRRAEIPAAGGHGNARSVGLLQSVLACGGELGGRRFLSGAGCEAVFEEQSNGPDLALTIPIRFGMGYGLTTPDMGLPPDARTCYWGGYGGSVIMVDLDARMTIAYMMNRMESGLVGDFRGLGIVGAARAALDAA
ncbi:MAG: serine hydrolase domain-containing protein [Acidimicrobiales bacterium]